jgi:hypothetical protein
MSIRRTLTLGVMSVLAGAAPSQLSGLYTVHPQRLLSATNFQTLAGATSALRTQGVSGPVAIEIYDDAGPYVESQTFYAPFHATLGQNLQLGNNQCVLLLGQFTGVSAVNRVTFRAAPGESPVIDATGKACGIYFNNGDFITLEGLEVRNATFDAINLYTASTQNALSNAVRRCRIADCGGVGVLCYGNSGAVVDTLIEGNLFSNCMMTGGGSFSGSARDGYVACRRDNNTQVLFNTFLVGTLASSSVTFPPWVVGVHPSNSTQTGVTKFEGNVVVKTVSTGVVLRFIAPTGAGPTLPATCDRNVYWTPNGGDFAGTGTFGAPIAHPTFAAWQTASGLDALSVVADPLFAPVGSPAFHLASNSPCIGFGPTTYSGTVTVDHNGYPRDAAPDAGCDEFVGNPAAEVLYVGSGCAGGSGLFQTLLAVGRPALGNSAFALGMPRAPGGTTVVLFVAFAFDQPPLFFGSGCRLYLSQASLASLIGTPYYPFAVDTSPPGGGYLLPLPLPNDAGLAGITVDVQGAMFDAGAPLGFTLTNALAATMN